MWISGKSLDASWQNTFLLAVSSCNLIEMLLWENQQATAAEPPSLRSHQANNAPSFSQRIAQIVMILYYRAQYRTVSSPDIFYHHFSPLLLSLDLTGLFFFWCRTLRFLCKWLPNGKISRSIRHFRTNIKGIDHPKKIAGSFLTSGRPRCLFSLVQQ